MCDTVLNGRKIRVDYSISEGPHAKTPGRYLGKSFNPYYGPDGQVPPPTRNYQPLYRSGNRGHAPPPMYRGTWNWHEDPPSPPAPSSRRSSSRRHYEDEDAYYRGRREHHRRRSPSWERRR